MPNLAALRAAVILLSAKTDGGAHMSPPPAVRGLKTDLHYGIFKRPEAICPKLFAVGVNHCHHRLLGTREPCRQFFIRIKMVECRFVVSIVFICRLVECVVPQISCACAAAALDPAAPCSRATRSWSVWTLAMPSLSMRSTQALTP